LSKPAFDVSYVYSALLEGEIKDSKTVQSRLKIDRRVFEPKGFEVTSHVQNIKLSSTSDKLAVGDEEMGRLSTFVGNCGVWCGVIF